MVTLVESVGWGLILLAGVGYTGIAVRTNCTEDFPGKASFVASCLLIGGLLPALTFLLAIDRLEPIAPPIAAFGYVVLFLGYAATLIAPLAWARFALVFTGQRIPTDRRTFVRIGLPVIIALVAVAVFTAVPLLAFVSGQKLIEDRHFDLLVGGVEYITTVTAFYLGALLVVGASLIGWTSYTYRHLSNKGGALLGIGFVLPWVMIVMPEITGFFDGQPVLVTYHIAVGSVVGLGAVSSAVYQHELFGEIPAAGTVGREVTVEEMTDPVLVVDADHRLVDLNAAAERAFGASVEWLGVPLKTVFDGALQPDELLADPRGKTELTSDHRTYEATPSELQDEYGRILGYSVVFHDITDRKRRGQRIQVLNRVLRHNLRNDLNLVAGYAELLEEQTTDPDDYTVDIQETATDLIATGEKAREIEDVIATQREHRTAPLAETIERVLAETQPASDDCTIQVDLSAGNELVDRTVLPSVLRELVENACQHNDAADPRVEIRTTVDATEEYPVTVTVADNGPGIPDHELAPIRKGTETSLEHASGLGLWLVEWGVASLDGLLELEDNEPRGTVATLRLQPVA